VPFRADVAISVGHVNTVLPINVQNEALSRSRRLERGSMPWNKVIWWAILLVIGLIAYMTYLQLAPMD
jgi:polyferredoxin